MSDRTLTLDLNGNFNLRETESGKTIFVPSGNKTALLAMLATSQDYKRSRDWLKTRLWSDRGEKQANDSLRNVIYDIRKNCLKEAFAFTLNSDRAHVWLESIVVTPLRGVPGLEFFEDARTYTNATDEWLRYERAAYVSKSKPIASVRDGGPDALPGRIEQCVAVSPPVYPLGDKDLENSASALCNEVVHGLRTQGMVVVLDQRDIDTDQLSQFGDGPVLDPTATVQAGVAALGNEVQLSTIVRHVGTQRVIWSTTETYERKGKNALSFAKILELGNSVVDAVHVRLLSSGKGTDCANVSSGKSTFTAIHHILGMSPSGQRAARRLLRNHFEAEENAVARAWYAFSAAHLVGECSPELNHEVFDEAEAMCARAIELEPSNGLVLALVAHVYGFVLRRLDYAAELASNARKAAPQLANAWDLSAMNALYNNDIEKGYEFSCVARRLGKHSPYKPLFDSSLAISAAVTGRHEQALATGEALLLRRPGFLAVMRHITPSLVATGRVDEAREMIKQIRVRDPNFVRARVLEPSYPLPCRTSVDLIGKTFRMLGES